MTMATKSLSLGEYENEILHLLDGLAPEEAMFALGTAAAHIIGEHVCDEDQDSFVDQVAGNIKTFLEIDRELAAQNVNEK
jgi:hypothetical protein